MFKAIMALFAKKPYQKDLQVINRLRFDSIHSGKHLGHLKNIYSRLFDNDESLSDDEIIEQYLNFSKNIQTNTFAAAELELVSLSTLCYFRPQLTGVLIRPALLDIVYSIGDNINFDDIINFSQVRILKNDVEPYGGWPHDEGLDWLNNIFPNKKELIEPILLDVIEKNKEG